MSGTTTHRPLRPLDNAYLDCDRPARKDGTEIGVLLRFAEPIGLSVDDWRASVAARLDAVPDLRLVPHRPRRRWLPMRWAAAEPDLDHHVREVRSDGLREAAEEVMARRLPLDRPLWQFTVLRDAAGDEAVLLRVHHALADGVGMVELGTRLLGLDLRVPPPVDPAKARWARLRAWGEVITGTPRYLRGFVPLSGRAFTSRGLTGNRRFAWAQTTVARLHSVARQHGVTGAEVYLAALAGALRQWPHTPWRSGPRTVWALVPFDTRAADDRDDVGNRVVNLRVPLPCAEPDPRRRLALIADVGGAGRRRRAEVMRAGVEVLPRTAVRTLFWCTYRRWHVELVASNVASLGNRMSHRGNLITDASPVGFLPHKRPLGVVLGAYGDQVSLHVTADAALPRPDVLCKLWIQSLDELASLPALPPPHGRDR